MLNKPIIIKSKKFFDKRGFFQEVFLKKNIKTSLIFTAIAYSKKNVIRGLHFQTKNKQTKIIYVAEGKILDVVVNLKKKSKDFGKVSRFILSQGDVLIVPNFFAHGYECLSNTCSIFYHLDNYRNPKAENGIRFNDKELKIKWFTKKPIMSERDKFSGSFNDFRINIGSL
jgi:dTDP-4-dehydrorhamnose 3,5-epimerase